MSYIGICGLYLVATGSKYFCLSQNDFSFRKAVVQILESFQWNISKHNIGRKDFIMYSLASVLSRVIFGMRFEPCLKKHVKRCMMDALVPTFIRYIAIYTQKQHVWWMQFLYC